MAPNMFATMVNWKTNRITLVLVYALLEWALIFFLLLNSLFSYLIIKFANYFGLKRPCLVCSRIDHVFEPLNSNSSYRDLICEHHSIELSRSGYCFRHRKLVQSQDMCEGCYQEIGMVKSDADCEVEDCDLNLNLNLRSCCCCCCGVAIKTEILAPHALIKTRSVVLEEENIDDELPHDAEPDRMNIQTGCPQSDLGKGQDSSESFSSWLSKEGHSLVEAEGEEDEGDVVMEAETEPLLKGSAASTRDSNLIPQHLEFYVDLDDYQLIPVDSPVKSKVEIQDGSGEGDRKGRDQELMNELWTVTDEELVLEHDVTVPSAAIGNLELGETEIEDFPTKQGQVEESALEHDITVAVAVIDAVERFVSSSLGSLESGETKIKDLPTNQGHHQGIKREIGVGVESDEIKITELPSEKGQEEAGDDAVQGQAAATTRYIDFHVAEKRDVVELNVNNLTSDFGGVCHNETDEIDIDRSQVARVLRPCKDDCPSTDDVICEAFTSFSDLLDKGDDEPKQNETTQNHDDMTVEITEPVEMQSEVAIAHEPDNVEGGRILDTPDSVDILRRSHREMPLLQSLGSESSETLDGSIENELEGVEEVAIVEELKSLLEFERNALHALYAELDEERNAAAVATNETLAMINRLQEEKATIEMEALQYQRMMEEQSEYDQEALQLMNEMLVKREKELRELEKELEVCRKKVIYYEERERMRLLSQMKDRSCIRSRTFSASCSNGEESDEVSVDLNNESREEDGYGKCEENGHHHNTPVDAILDLQDPLSSFEEERMSILEQLKDLEEQLCTLAEEEEHHVENMKPSEQFYGEKAPRHRRQELQAGANGLDNGSFVANGKHHQGRRLNGSMPKQLLPLFDAAELESDSELSNGVEDGMKTLATQKPLPTKYELEKKRLAIEEEVDHVYERLHALEDDREFVKHCIESLRKGDKGVHLLQEILQNLRDLKNVELQARNICASC